VVVLRSASKQRQPDAVPSDQSAHRERYRECTDVGPSQGATECIWLHIGELVCARIVGGCAE